MSDSRPHPCEVTDALAVVCDGAVINILVEGLCIGVWAGAVMHKLDDAVMNALVFDMCSLTVRLV